jgi:hypothetical protein
LDAVEFHANGDVDEDVVLDINGAFLQYLLKDDALRYKLTITSPNKSDSDNYTFVSSALNSGDGIWGTAYFYNGYIDGFTSMNMMVWFDPFRIVIYQKEEDRYLIAPASNAEEAIWIKERSDQFFQL